jgi:hypothetical protein
MSRKSTFINQETNVYTTLHLRDIKYEEHGAVFYADSELEAYQLAFMYSNPAHDNHGSDVDFCKEKLQWKVTAYNSKAHGLGFERAIASLVGQ